MGRKVGEGEVGKFWESDEMVGGRVRKVRGNKEREIKENEKREIR